MISHCPICAAEAPAAPAPAAGTVWNRCWNCEAQFQCPRTAGELPTEAPRLPRARGVPAPGEQIETMLTRFEPYRRAGRLLDVGFGDGQILGAAAAEGWQCWGTETSRAALEFGRRHGWRVLSGDLCRIGLPEALFDVICMAHVLEYLDQPAAYLREAIRLLRPGGLLYLSTTSTHVADLQPPGPRPCYLQLFTTTAVRLALETAGYTHEHISVGPAERGSSSQLLTAALQQLFRAYPAGARLTAFAERPH